ncbi:MAG: nitroreductase family deazaflavin-dependent oxidoreductase [Rubrobacter sp.]|nr:nitroreductase family deazaflavin-dependent oxidoreductase [Rubrobacter sp.]
MNDEPVAPVYLGDLAREDFCYLTTTGRATGKPHAIEIWFAFNGRTPYMLSGGRDSSDWVRNIRRRPQARVRISQVSFGGSGRVAENPEEDTLARRLLIDKYRSERRDLASWGRTALCRLR